MKNQIKHQKILKAVKWVLIGFGSLLLAFLVFAAIVSYIYRDKVKDLIQAELNKHLQSEIIIGETDLSLLRNFPHASFIFYDVVAKEAVAGMPLDTLMQAGSVALNFNIIDIFKGRYNIKGIDLREAEINLRIFEDGTNNYTFWKKDTTDKADAFEIILEKIKCRDVSLCYQNRMSAQNYNLWLENADFSGRLYDSEYALTVSAKTLVNNITIDELSFLAGQSADIDLVLDINTNDEFYNIEKGSLRSGSMNFIVLGNVFTQDNISIAEINVTSNRLDLKDFIKEIPRVYSKHIDAYDMKGRLEMHLKVEGPVSRGYTPDIKLDFELVSGDIIQKDNRQALTNVTLAGWLTNGPQRSISTTKLILDAFSANLQQGHINGTLSIENFVTPRISFESKAEAPIDELLNIFDIDIFNHASGDINIDVTFKTQLKNWDGFMVEDFLKSRCYGIAHIKNGAFTLKNHKKINDVNARLKFSNNDIVIESLRAYMGPSDFSFKGYFRNALAYLFLPDENIMVDAVLNSDFIALDDLLSDTEEDKSSTYMLSFSPQINFRLAVNIGQLHFEKFQAQHVKGEFALREKILYGREVALKALDGSLKIDGTVDGTKEGILNTNLKAQIHNCDINKMFTQLNNFGQTELVDKNIKGILTSTVYFGAACNNALNFDLNSVSTVADINIKNGELINYKPIEAMSRFLRVDDLSHIRFQTLENRIEINQQLISIPDMSIRSNAINIDAAGTHSFSNEIDYRLQIFLSDVLGRRARAAKRQNEEFGVVQDDGLGDFTLFIKIGGTVSNPDVNYDMRGHVRQTGENIREDLRQTGQQIREQFTYPTDSSLDTVARLKTARDSAREERRERRRIPEEFELEFD